MNLCFRTSLASLVQAGVGDGPGDSLAFLLKKRRFAQNWAHPSRIRQDRMMVSACHSCWAILKIWIEQTSDDYCPASSNAPTMSLSASSTDSRGSSGADTVSRRLEELDYCVNAWTRMGY
jgi:hypothetical protein